ncbi:hypothetical protein ACTFSJ_27795 [Bacillus cereus group sp. MYBK12-2]|uniref:hypothetical protein n=1 Tax=Bacillus cereus group sp. MYBK12-2 TaxID=3450689 RepID=UPI0032F206F0|nr:hypothetical protein [Bacillus pacificus]HDR7653577.1 hypothetical protein [Bacillus pacificus]
MPKIQFVVETSNPNEALIKGQPEFISAGSIVDIRAMSNRLKDLEEMGIVRLYEPPEETEEPVEDEKEK